MYAQCLMCWRPAPQTLLFRLIERWITFALILNKHAKITFIIHSVPINQWSSPHLLITCSPIKIYQNPVSGQDDQNILTFVNVMGFSIRGIFKVGCNYGNNSWWTQMLCNTCFSGGTDSGIRSAVSLPPHGDRPVLQFYSYNQLPEVNRDVEDWNIQNMWK